MKVISAEETLNNRRETTTHTEITLKTLHILQVLSKLYIMDEVFIKDILSNNLDGNERLLIVLQC